jgi:hypothetical protein
MRNRPNVPGQPDVATQVGPAGGAPGLPPSPNHILPGPLPVVGSFSGRPPGPKPKKFRIMNGGFLVQGGVRVVIRAGKEVDETQYNLRFLKSQGFRLEEVTDDLEMPPLGMEGIMTPDGSPRQNNR